MFEPGMPTYVRLGGKKSKGFMSGDEKPVTGFGAYFGCKVIGLIFKVLIRLWANHVTTIHRVPVFFNRSSRRRCFSSQ